MTLQTLLISSGAAFFIAILAIRFRKFLSLTLTKMIYGQYSFEFFSLYKKYFIRSPFQYCFRDEFISHLLIVLERQQNTPYYKSPKEIYFEKTPYFLSFREFIKQKGKPYCFNAFSFHNPDFVIKALGYRDKIAGSKAVIVFYFMNDLFFMGEYIFRNPKTKIRESLVGHFLEDSQVREDNFFIENTRKRVVHYQDTGFTVDIKYLTMENDLITNNLISYLNQLRNRRL